MCRQLHSIWLKIIAIWSVFVVAHYTNTASTLTEPCINCIIIIIFASFRHIDYKRWAIKSPFADCLDKKCVPTHIVCAALLYAPRKKGEWKPNQIEQSIENNIGNAFILKYALQCDAISGIRQITRHLFVLCAMFKCVVQLCIVRHTTCYIIIILKYSRDAFCVHLSQCL